MARWTRTRIRGLGRRIHTELREHLDQLGFMETGGGMLCPPDNEKESLRAMHRLHRSERLSAEADFLRTETPKLLSHFADGDEVIPSRISPRLQLVDADTWEARLFRLASLTWSVPVSQGYGRRMRFLVWDDCNNKLIGLIALGDPVFNLRVRDGLIGWTAQQREQRLVNVMDAYVLGALPPYNQLLGGKMVACLVRSREVRDLFSKRYGQASFNRSRTYRAVEHTPSKGRVFKSGGA